MNGNDPQAQLKQAFDAALAAYGAGRWVEAEAAFRRVLAQMPQQPDTLHLLGLTLHFQGRSAEGIASIERAIEIFPDNPAYHNNLGNALMDCGEAGAAEAAYRQATQVQPDYPIAWQGLGTLALLGKRPREAIDHFRAALRAKPDYAPAENGIGNALLDLGRLDEAIAHYRAAVRLDPTEPASSSNLLMAMHYDAHVTPSALHDAHRAWGETIAGHIPQRTTQFVNSRNTDRRLRIGYISADFRRHSVAYFIEPVIAAHDRAAVEVTLYADVPRPDTTTARLRASADRWQDILRLDDADIAKLVEDDGIDILIDLAGHTSGNRLGVFARRPAPVQATWIGYPGITGLASIDWRLTDAIADPAIGGDSSGSEKFLRLQEGFLCYRPVEEAPSIAPLPAGRNRPITFASFNALMKISADTVALWARVLHAVPGARLLIKSEALGDADAQVRLLREFDGHGIVADRLDLMGYVAGVGSHLSIYGQVDIALDTIPYNGTTTTMEALWMGVPVITLRGDRHAGRVGASLLTRADLSDLVAATPDAFVEIAAALATNRERLASLRDGMRARLTATTLIDSERFTRGVEVAYRTMWRHYLVAGAGGGRG